MFEAYENKNNMNLDSIDVKKFHPVKTARVIATLLTNPKYQANLFRIEFLLEFVIANFEGEEIPSSLELEAWLNEYEPLKSEASTREDPPEDLFLRRLSTVWGDFRVFSGPWNAEEYYALVILEVCNSLPNQVFADVTKPIKALLLLSDKLVERTGLDWLTLPEDNAHRKIEVVMSSEKHKHLMFSSRDLASCGLSISALSSFIFNLDARNSLNKQGYGTSDLERRPLLMIDDELFFIRPTAVGLALRRFFIEWVIDSKNVERFERELVRVYSRRLRHTSILFGNILSDAPLVPSKKHESILIDVGLSVETGRSIQVIAIIDSLSERDRTGFEEVGSMNEALNREVSERIQKFQQARLARGDFRSAVSVIIGCGFGRATALGLNDLDSRCDILSINSYDLETLQWLPDMSKTAMWKFAKQLSILEKRGVYIRNYSGFLNLIGWWRDSNSSLLPENVEVQLGQHQEIVIPTDCIAAIRLESASSADERMATYIDKSYRRIKKKNLTSDFAKSSTSCLYMSVEDMQKRNLLACAFVSGRAWWVQLKKQSESKLPPDLQFKLWDVLHNWMGRIAPILHHEFPTIYMDSILFELDLSAMYFDESVVKNSYSGAELVSKAIDTEKKTVFIKLHADFFHAVHNPINIAERSMVEACVEGFILLSKATGNVSSIVDQIVVNQDARYFHIFSTYSYVDAFFHNRHSFIEIDDIDASFLKLSVGFSNESRKVKNVNGRAACMSFLAKRVDELYNELITDLTMFNRQSVVKVAFDNICGIEQERGTWKRTSRAVVGLGQSMEDFVKERREHFEKLTSADIATRLIIEIASCHSLETGGLNFDRYDLSEAMSKASMIFVLGNFSDGIDKNIVDPQIQIAPNRTIKISHDFLEEIMTPMTLDLEYESSKDDITGYGNFFGKRKPDKQVKQFSDEFLSAFRAEFHIELDDMLKFIRVTADLCDSRAQDILIMERHELFDHIASSGELTNDNLDLLLSNFSMIPRAVHAKPPLPYSSKDVMPWLFRRRLSVLFKPIVQLDSGNRFVVVPGFIMRSFTYVVDLYWTAAIDSQRCVSDRMKSWIGDEAHRRGNNFNHAVAEALRAKGYETLSEVKVSSMLPPQVRGAVDYGDFDVVAWRKDSSQLYLIECKKLIFAKTFRELGEQLQEFQGELRNGKPDRLLKHLNRTKLVEQNAVKLLTDFPGLKAGFSVHPFLIFSNRVPALYDKRINTQISVSFLDQVVQYDLSANPYSK